MECLIFIIFKKIGLLGRKVDILAKLYKVICLDRLNNLLNKMDK